MTSGAEKLETLNTVTLPNNMVVTEIKIPIHIYDEGAFDPEYRIWYQTPDEETLMKVCSVLEQVDRINAAQIASVEIEAIEKELGLIKEDSMDKNGQIIPAFRYVDEDDNGEECRHFKNGQPYRLFDMAHSYELPSGYVRDEKNMSLSQNDAALFRTRLKFYRNKEEAMRSYDTKTVQIELLQMDQERQATEKLKPE